jgi:peptidoglycan hydrolase CwlO-like protein
MRSNLAEVAWMVRDHTRIDRENRELEEDIVAREEAIAAAARDKARYHADLAAVAEEEVARAEAVEEQARVAVEEEDRPREP